MKYSFELNNAVSGNYQIGDKAAFKRMVEICNALFHGDDVTRYGADVDKVAGKLKESASRAAMGDVNARMEINEIVKYTVAPVLTQQINLLSFLGNFKKIGYHEIPVIEVPVVKGAEPRIQAAGGSVQFGTHTRNEQPVSTVTISSGIRVNYRELAAGDFDGSIAAEEEQARTNLMNKAVYYVLDVLKAALNNATGVKFYAEYSDLTKTVVDDMIKTMRPLGKTNILADYSVLSAINEFGTGFKTVGEMAIPFYTTEQVDAMAKAGLYGWYNGAVLTEIANPYNLTKPLADGTGFEQYFNPGDAWFIPSGVNGPVHIFQRGDLTAMTGNDVNTGDMVTRLDLEVGAGVVEGREYEIGLITHQGA